MDTKPPLFGELKAPLYGESCTLPRALIDPPLFAPQRMPPNVPGPNQTAVIAYVTRDEHFQALAALRATLHAEFTLKLEHALAALNKRIEDLGSRGDVLRK